ncbi:30S ribosomal protein S17e [Candidatus Woesearchaeota archaeon]|nr:30S ribosomal protein S17e [Candidatus Woesearchaeota archaeon]
MGRIKTRISKSVTKDIMDKHAGKFSSDFEKNKQAIESQADIASKKLRNVIAGYATRLKKSGKY